MFRRRMEFRVSLVPPSGVDAARLRAYIEEAVGTWCGQLRPMGGYGDDDPGDPLFHLDRDSVKVSRIHRRRTYDKNTSTARPPQG